jgi:hypothetical protein
MDADTLARLSRLLRGRPEDVDNLTQQELVLIAFGTGGNAATIARAEELNEDTEAALRYAVRLILSQRVEARRNRQHGYQCAAFGCVERATRLCSSCGCAAYCSRACQKESWQAVGRCAGQRPHRETCAEAAAVIASLRQQPDVQQDLRDSGPGTAFRCKELLIFMCGLVSYPMHGVDNVDGMHKALTEYMIMAPAHPRGRVVRVVCRHDPRAACARSSSTGIRTRPLACILMAARDVIYIY